MGAGSGGILEKAGHRWEFFRFGGFDQVLLERGADIESIPELDQKLWTAISCPSGEIEFEPRMLSYLDSDKDGRIRVQEVIAAVRWTCSLLKDHDELVQGRTSLSLSSIDDSSDEGRRIIAAAKRILAELSRERDSLTMEDSSQSVTVFTSLKLNGDGIVPPESADDDVVRQVIVDILSCVGSITDRSSLEGISKAKVEEFLSDAAFFEAWWSQGKANAEEILPLGDGTVDALHVLDEVRDKVDDYFVRCSIAAYDPRAAQALNRDDADYVRLAERQLSASGSDFADFPLAMIAADKPLPLGSGVNPGWRDAIQRFREQVVIPILGDRHELHLEEWRMLCAKLEPCRSWLLAKQGGSVEKLGLERIREIVTGESTAAVLSLIAKDQELESEYQALESVDKLVHYTCLLHKFLNNFVSFRDFYKMGGKAMFQAGSLYIDGRCCDLCLKVADVTKHATLATLSRIYLLYCTCVRPSEGASMTIVAAVTTGEAKDLVVGRNGVFYDRQGRDWDATIMRIVENPISIRQSFWTPYRRFATMISEQIEKFAAAKDKGVQEKASIMVADGSQKVETAGKTPGQPAAPTPFDVGKFAGIFAAIGLAVGAIGTAIAALVTGLLGLVWWQMLAAPLGLMLVISGPSMIIAWLKLRNRTLSPLLDAGGWAVNARARINIPFGNSLTRLAQLPKGAHRNISDPFATKKTSRISLVVLLISLVILAVLLAQLGILPLP